LFPSTAFPGALVQRSLISDSAEDFESLGAIVEVPADSVTIDYLIADPRETGQGIGTAVIGAIVADTWTTYPTAPAIIVGVVADNTATRRALEKAGFRRVGEGDMEPDNPCDPLLHVISRLDRPELPATLPSLRLD
jgi:aminoglycoside 6'-N-acetyltransferase